MSESYLNKSGLAYFWSKIKAWASGVFAPVVHTHTAFKTKHSYTVAANAAKNWYRIANANTSQTDTTKPIHAQFILTAYNASYSAAYYERWFVNAEVFGGTAHIVILGNSNAPFSQARILYENTVADLDANDRPAIDIYLNYQLANGTTKIEIEEVYNSGWTFVADGQISASTVPTGFEGLTCAPRSNGVTYATNSDYATLAALQRSNFTSNFTLADNNTYRARVLNCTGNITVTVPSINSTWSWFVIKNFNTTSGVITIHPSTTSVLIDGSNANITLQPGEYIMIHSKAANAYTIVFDGRWKSQKADKATTLEGYGITDAKIANGTITLGSNSITPLTSHQDISGKVNKSGDRMTGDLKISTPTGNQLRLISGNYGVFFRNDGNAFYLLQTASGQAENGSWTSARPLTLNLATGVCSINGNSATATRFASNQQIALSGAVTGSASSTAGWDITTTWRHSIIGQYGAIVDNKVWYKAAYVDCTSAYHNYEIVFLVERTYFPWAYGILSINIRTDGSGFVAFDETYDRWLVVESIISHNDFVLVCPTTAFPTVELWVKIGNPYSGIKFTVLSEGSRIDSSFSWTLCNTGFTEGGFASIPTQGNYKFSYNANQCVKNSNPFAVFQFDNLVRGTPPANDIYNFLAMTYDTNGNYLCGVQTTFYSSGYTNVSLIAHSNISSVDDYSYFNLVNNNCAHGIDSNVSFVNLNTNAFQQSMYGGNTYYNLFAGGNAYDGACLSLLGRSHTYNPGWFMLHASSMSGSGSAGQRASLFGQPNGTLSWNGQPLQTSSDRRLKTKISAVDDDVLDAWDGVFWGEFKFLDAVAEKGAGARLHVGLIAQDVDESCASLGVDICRYGILCHDTHSDGPDEPAADLWMARYTEALCMEAAYQRRENDRLKKRVADLEERLAALELKVS